VPQHVSELDQTLTVSNTIFNNFSKLKCSCFFTTAKYALAKYDTKRLVLKTKNLIFKKYLDLMNKRLNLLLYQIDKYKKKVQAFMSDFKELLNALENTKH
jgi:hypothetical protein